MEQEANELAERLKKIPEEIEQHIRDLEAKLAYYDPFNVLANVIVNNQFQFVKKPKKDSEGKSPAIQEYLALVCLKSPYRLPIGELTRANQVIDDFVEINRLAELIVQKHSVLNYGRYKLFKEDGTVSDLDQVAQALSGEELLVRNTTFESFHWDQLEELYRPYDAYFKQRLGFTVDEGIRICETVGDYMTEGSTESLRRLQKSAKQMADEVLAYKHRNKRPQNFYPDEYLETYKKWEDRNIRDHFWDAMATYEMTVLGHMLSFTVKDIVDMEGLDDKTVQSFLQHLSIGFGEIKPDFTQPEIMHPLKNRPILRHEDHYLCSSLFLLDYALDRLFADVLNKDSKKAAKYQQHRHDYLLEKGVTMIADTLRTKEVYKNLNYPGGELDGMIFCDTNVFYVEAKGHLITDRAKKGFLDRIENHINDVIKHSHEQGLRTHDYFFGKKDVVFTDKNGRKVVLDGTRFKNFYFISLALEDVSAFSCNLKVNNSLELFDKGTFPWIVNLYDLRVVCEHMEGPAYFIQYLNRRREFFKYNKFKIDDELDILGYYLQRNLRFDDLIEQYYDKVGAIKLESFLDHFNHYYHYKDGKVDKPVQKMKHYTVQPIKTFVAAVQDCGYPACVDAAVQLLEFGSATKKLLLQYLRTVKKRVNKDGEIHDFRVGGDDTDGRTWMLSYVVASDTPKGLEIFWRFVADKNREDPSHSYIAILDTSYKAYRIKEIIHYLNNELPLVPVHSNFGQES